MADEALERIVDEAKRAGRIVRSSIGFAKASDTPMWSEDLGGLVRRMAEIVRPYVAARGGSLALPVTGESTPMAMRPIELEQMLVNLVRNAAESSADGAHIELRTRVSGDQAVVEVIDDGLGIPAEARAS